MATTKNTHTGNGTEQNFAFTFPYIKQADVKASINGTDTTEFTFHNATTVRFNSAPANDAAIVIYRSTSGSDLVATFYPGSAIRSTDLNDNFTQNLYVTQEASDLVEGANTDSAAALALATTADANATTALNNSRESDGSGGYNSAISIANTASTTATNAKTTAESAEAAVSSVLPYTIVANKAALLAATVSEDDIYEVTDTTDMEDLGDSDDVIWVNAAGSTSGQDIAALKPNVTWDSGITLKMKKYGTNNTDRKWIFQSYFSNDPETKYAPKASPTFTGTVTGPTINASTALQIGGTAITSTAAELNYTDGVTSNIQTQLNAKAPLASPTFTGTVTTASVSTDGQYIQQEETLTVSSNATTVNCSTGNYFTVTASGDITFTFGTVPADTKSYAMVIEVNHDSGALTWPAAVKWPADTAPTLTTGKTHQFYFHTNDNGSRWRGASLVDYVD